MTSDETPIEPSPEPTGLRRWPPVCAAVIAGSVALFVLDAFLSQGATLRAELGPVFQRTALFGPLVQEGQYWRVLTCVFAHGGPIHLFFNMMVAYSLGAPLERSIGSGRFLLISLVTAMGASTFAMLFNFTTPTVGASGMILGWGGAMFVTSGQEFRRSLLLWFAQVAVISLLPGVSWAGHLGGLLFGLPLGLALRSGPRVFSLAAPLLLAITVAVVYIAAHPERFRGTP
ncbi:rhomboid family intramembrane serine protease [Archangium violaceum]|uniref:rhomboid family intramembrane serine protease n=1 Tax=Archangium violaceum TaxID=83451 RepID=UPI00193C0EE1|nr:rhomboid family intramembrane serine protease [Archangium violaceum]QRK05437.1 rhomboid family intramembrane serine protease [Archangium violaceum]